MQPATDQSPEPVQKTNLLEQYRAIGPAAILAALLHASRSAGKPSATPASSKAA